MSLRRGRENNLSHAPCSVQGRRSAFMFYAPSPKLNPSHSKQVIGRLEHMQRHVQSVSVHVDHSLGKGLRGFLRQIMPNAACDNSVRIFA
jgi:hypothetical protein